MNDFQLKIILVILSSIVFSFLFILLALIAPIEKETQVIKKQKNKLETVSESFKNR
jgi:hypothetical protein